VLDAGASTVMFPYVQSAEEARRAVAATRYPPEGVRGVAGMSRASKFGTVNHYLKTANAGVGVIVQLESREALQRVDEIAAVPGVDALFIGPSDLSADLGHLGEPMHPQVMELMGQAVRRARAVGRHVGSLGGTPEQLAQYRAMGFDYMALSSDLGLLMRGAQTALSALRTQEVGAHVHTLNAGTRTADGY
jgi:2-keto-3-deoxy-L-rhamnonate aldolase RhmA